jgi:hypothetical protein
MRMRVRSKAGMALLIVASASPAAVIADVSGGTTTGLAVYFSQFVQVSWTLPQAYNNVDISIPLFSWTANTPFSGIAYLTDDSTHAPPPIASAPYSGVTDFASPVEVELFSGLQLRAGTFYLTLASNDNGPSGRIGAIWLEGSGLPSLDAGVVLFKPSYANLQSGDTLNRTYPPETAFPAGGSVQELQLTITGDAVPEPTNLVCSALVSASSSRNYSAGPGGALQLCSVS